MYLSALVVWVARPRLNVRACQPLERNSAITSPTRLARTARSLRELSIRSYSLDDRRCVVVLAGDIDLASSPALKAALIELCELGYTQFVLDLSDVCHLDSTGLGVLVGLQKRLDGRGRLALAGVPPNVARLFRMVGLDERLETFPTVEASLADIGRLEPQLAVTLEACQRAPHPASPPSPAMTAPRTAPLAVDADAAIVLGLGSTALPFAESSLAEAERWLRILRRYGDAGRILREAGMREAPFTDLGSREGVGSRPLDSERAQARLIAVGEQARNAAADRGADLVGTLDVLDAVARTYASEFDRVLAAYGGDPAAVHHRLGDT